MSGNLISFILEVDVPTTHGSTVVCFESHLVAGLGLPTSKFPVAIIKFLGCELVLHDVVSILAGDRVGY
jgi:hypothetical protein